MVEIAMTFIFISLFVNIEVFISDYSRYPCMKNFYKFIAFTSIHKMLLEDLDQTTRKSLEYTSFS